MALSIDEESVHQSGLTYSTSGSFLWLLVGYRLLLNILSDNTTKLDELNNKEGMIVFFRLLRLITLIRIFHLATQKRHLEKLITRLVSGNKRRYAKDGFDLDLGSCGPWITLDRGVVMDSVEGMARHAVKAASENVRLSGPTLGATCPARGTSYPGEPRGTQPENKKGEKEERDQAICCQEFLRENLNFVPNFHVSRHTTLIRISFLPGEWSYDPKYFYHRVHRIMIDDHNVPTLEEMVSFSKEVIAWLSKDPHNIIVIHCKGGKGASAPVGLWFR
ncbi:phosphatidylinositol 3,4,5-trisphosphate 3-phosphatase TPTE2-like [Thomomys bottae]